MNIETIAEELQNHPFLAELPEEQVTALTGCASNAHYAEGALIVQQGGAADYCYLIRKGLVAIEVEVPGRENARLQTLGPGEFLGWSWLISPFQWHFHAVAVEDTDMIMLDGECLRTKCRTDRDLGFDMLMRLTKAMERRIDAMQNQIQDFYAVPASP